MSGNERARPNPPAVRVSVVVAVYNPADGFDDLIASLDAQSLGAEEFEVILCDDGSDEPTRDRLAEVARVRPNLRVLTLPHTGWPGTPRNHGIDAARGTYVFFSDQDDRLFPEALRDMCDYADAHSSDVVVGKVVGVGRRIPRRLFRRDIPRAVLGEDPLLELLTPHKLFRTSFLREHGIRFPDGKVRLEDHLFVMRAYFAATVISVLASRPCYAWIKHRGSASSSRIDPETYFPHLETVLALVVDNTEPGSLRDTLLRHWYRGKILKRIEGRRMVRYPEDYRTRYLDVVTPLVHTWFGAGVDEGLTFPQRIRSWLLRGEHRTELLRFAEFEASLECGAEVTSAQWTRGGRLRLGVTAHVKADGRAGPVFRERDGGSRRTVWTPPDSLASAAFPVEVLDAGRDLGRDRIEVGIRDAVNGREWRAPSRPAPDLEPVVVTIDPLTLFSSDDRAVGRLVADVRHAGWTFETPLRADPDLLARAGASPLAAGRRCRLVGIDDGSIELRLEGPARGWRDAVGRTTRRAAAFARRRAAR